MYQGTCVPIPFRYSWITLNSWGDFGVNRNPPISRDFPFAGWPNLFSNSFVCLGQPAIFSTIIGGHLTDCIAAGIEGPGLDASKGGSAWPAAITTSLGEAGRGVGGRAAWSA